MATQTKSNSVTDTIATATERLAELNEKAAANSRKASAAYLSSYENTVVSLADSYEKAAGASRVEWVSAVAAAQGRLRARGHEGLHGRRPRGRLLGRERVSGAAAGACLAPECRRRAAGHDAACCV